MPDRGVLVGMERAVEEWAAAQRAPMCCHCPISHHVVDRYSLLEIRQGFDERSLN